MRNVPVILGLLGSLALADPPATKPAPSTGDPATDFLLGAAGDAPPASAPASQPINPFKGRAATDEVRTGRLILSSGEKIQGNLTTTQGKPLRVWVEKDKAYHDIPFASVASAQATVLWEREEKEWRFRESGSDIKEFTGKSYPVRELQYTLQTKEGKTFTGSIVAPLYRQTKDGHAAFVLNKRQKGNVGQTLKTLVYVDRIELD